MHRHYILFNNFCILIQFGKDRDNENIFLTQWKHLPNPYSSKTGKNPNIYNFSQFNILNQGEIFGLCC